MGTETQRPTVAVRDEPPRREETQDASSSRTATGRGPLVALAAVVVAAFVLYTGLASLVDVPRVHPDELRYALAGASLAGGEGLHNRGEQYGFGPVHAAVLAAVLAVTPDRETAYPLWKAANALLFALSAIPIFLIARRLLRPWWSVGVAAASMVIPSSIYVSVVMTESASFVTASLAMYAIVLAVERPTVARQLAAVATIGLATATRAQFGVLFFAYLAALAGAWALPRVRPTLREELRMLWPTLGALVLGVLAFFARPLLTWSSASESLGPYRQLWNDYNLVDVARWTVYHAADLEIYLAVVPFAVAPIVLWRQLRRAREGAAREGAFAISFLTVNLSLLLMTAAFASLPYGYDRLHDRYLFYVVPLWLIVLAVWLADGLPRPLVATATGVGLALVLPVLLPFAQLANEAGVDTVPGALWVWVNTHTIGPGPFSGRRLLALLVILLLVAVVLLPRRYRLALPAAVLAVFVATAVLAWDRMIGAPEDAVFRGGLERSWIDERLPEDARVWKLYIEAPSCPASALTRHSLFLTEFFNSTVYRAAYIGGSIPDGIPIEEVNVGPGGRFLVAPEGEPFVADYVYTQPGIELNGRKLATGTNANLVLWQIGGPVVVDGASRNNEIRTVDCS